MPIIADVVIAQSHVCLSVCLSVCTHGYCEFCIASDDGEDESDVIVVSEAEDDDDNCNYGRDDDIQDEDDPWHFDRGNNLALLAASIPFCPNNNETTEGNT